MKLDPVGKISVFISQCPIVIRQKLGDHHIRQEPLRGEKDGEENNELEQKTRETHGITQNG